MTTQARNISWSIAVGGAVASSLPSSLQRTSKELQALQQRAADDRAELRRLSGELRGLEQGSEAYNVTAARVEELRGSLAETGAEQRRLVMEQRAAEAQSERTGAAFRRTAGFATALTGAVVGATAAVVGYSNRLRQHSALAALTGRTTRALDEDARALGVSLGDRDLGRSAIAALAELNQQGLTAQANFGAAAQAGIDVSALQRGVLTVQDVSAALADIATESDATSAAIRRSALSDFAGPELLAAAQQLGNTSDETLQLRRQLAGLSDDVLETRDNFARGLIPVLTPLSGLFRGASGAIADTSGPMQNVIGVGGVLALTVGGLATAMSGLGFVSIGLSAAWTTVTTQGLRAAIATRIWYTAQVTGTAIAGAFSATINTLTGSLSLQAAASNRSRLAQLGANAAQLAGATVSGALALGTGALAAAVGLKSTALFASVGAWVAATVAAIGFNVATGGVLLAIGALVAGAVLLVRNWDSVTSAVGALGDRVRGVFNSIPEPVKTFISVVFPIIGITRLIAANFDRLRSVAASVFGFIADVVRPVWELVSGIASAIGGIGRLFGLGGGSTAPAGAVTTGTGRRRGGDDEDDGRPPRTPPLGVDSRNPLPVDRRPLPVEQATLEVDRRPLPVDAPTVAAPDVTVRPVLAAAAPLAALPVSPVNVVREIAAASPAEAVRIGVAETRREQAGDPETQRARQGFSELLARVTAPAMTTSPAGAVAPIVNVPAPVQAPVTRAPEAALQPLAAEPAAPSRQQQEPPQQNVEINNDVRVSGVTDPKEAADLVLQRLNNRLTGNQLGRLAPSV